MPDRRNVCAHYLSLALGGVPNLNTQENDVMPPFSPPSDECALQTNPVPKLDEYAAS